MTNYDGAIINLYEKDTFISSHNDVDESKSAIKYPVIGINLGGKGNFSIERIPGAGQLSLEAGTGYIFGVDGVNREVWHRTFPTPQDTFLPELTTKIDGKTYPAGSYRVTITMRRVMPLEPGMPTAPAKITTQPTVQTVTAYRTLGTFSSKVDYAQRGSGAYYALDKPFQEIGSTDPVEQVDVVYDLSKTLDATTKEGQTKFIQIKRSAIEGKTFTSMKESNDAVRDAMIANGYNSLIGWIEEDVKDAGRELVIYEPTQSFVQESDRAENLNIFGLEGNNIPPTESCS